MTELTNGQENGFSMTELINGQEKYKYVYFLMVFNEYW
jgi:hypothetical protein